MLYKVLIRYIPILLATLSVMALLKEVYFYGFSVGLIIVIDYYSLLTEVFFGWMEPYIIFFGHYISSVFEFEFKFGKYWKDVFLLIVIYYLRDVTNFIRAKDVIGTLISFVVGIGVALVSSVATSSVDIYTKEYGDNYLGCLYPLWGFAVYRTFRGLWASYKYREDVSYIMDLKGRVRAYYSEVIIAIVISSHILLNSSVLNFSASPLAVLAMLIFILSIWNVYKGWSRSGGEFNSFSDRYASFRDHGNTRLGVDILAIFFFAVVFLISNAGLKLVGL